LTRVSKLDSGLTIVSAEMPYSASVSIGVFVKVGSRDESGSQYGASHFLEHLIFKGTESLSARDLAVVVDSFGGEMNAFTTKETTSFQLRLLDEAVEIGIDILGQILTAPALRPLDIDSERSVILEEIAMASDEPADLVQEMLASVIYNGHPLGREVLGSRESIISMDRATIDKFFTAYYGPPNMVVAAAGHVNHDLLIEKFQAMFTSLQGDKSLHRVQPVPKFGPAKIIERDIEQVHIALGFRGISRSDPRWWELAILDQLLGGGISSRLFQVVREDHGLCYSIYSDHVAFGDSGYMEVYFATTPGQVDSSLRLIDLVVKDLVSRGVTEEELAVAKRYLRAQLLLSMDDSGSVMSQIGSRLIWDREPNSVAEMLAEIESVSRAGVNHLAEELLESDMQICVVGPIGSDHLV
jgi:predicted Zn-dependent peptidase